MENRKEFLSVINEKLEYRKKDFENILKALVLKELFLKNDADKILSGELSIEHLRVEECVWIYEELFKAQIVQSPINYFFSNLEIKNSNALMKIMLSSNSVKRWIMLRREILNPERKIDYIKEKYFGQDIISVKDKINVFSRIGVIEQKYQLDLCNFNLEQLYELVSSMNTQSYSSFVAIKSFISIYYQWCYEKSIIVENRLSLPSKLEFINIDNSTVYRNSYFKDLDDVRGYVEAIRGFVSMTSINYFDTVIAILYLAWSGLTIEEAIKLKISDIDMNNGIIHVGKTKTVGFDDIEMLKFLKEYSQSTSYFGFSKKKDFQTYANCVYLLRNNRSDGMLNVNMVRQQLFNVYKTTHLLPKDNPYYDKVVNYTSVLRSSMYWRMYQYEQVNGSLDLKDKEFLQQVATKKFNCDSDYKYFLEEYHQWRKYFYNI